MNVNQQQHQQPVLQIKDGLLRGSIKADWKGKPYYCFRGIPYGKPPVGNLRFKAPQPADSWIGIKDATRNGNECYSRNLLKNIVGSEDCLYLNVYTPQLPTTNSELKPVMVWIHGGNFTSGSGSYSIYGPEFLIAEDVVVVSINYRLGIFGFTNFEDGLLEIPGNAGLKDQVLALKWVQQNIHNFCGNPKNVTIFGSSAGGSSVHYLMLSPLAKGLFHRAISQSGVSIAPWARGQRTAPLIAKILKLNTTDEAEIAGILQNLSVEELFELQEKIPDPFTINCLRPFAPIIETSGKVPMFLDKDPVCVIKSGNFNQVPFMVGYNSREGIFFVSEFDKWNANFELTIPHDLNIATNSQLIKTIVEELHQFYYGGHTPSYENIEAFSALQTDGVFFIPINKSVRYHTEYSKAPVYYYRMSADTNLNIFKIFTGSTASGASHGDELGYLFKTRLTPEFHSNSREEIVLNRIIKFWTTFAKNGNPNPTESDPLIPIVWPPAEEKLANFLEIGDNLTVGVNPDIERVELWDRIYALCQKKCKL